MITAKSRKAEILAAYENLLEENKILLEEIEKGKKELTVSDYVNDAKRRTKTHNIEFNLFVEDCGKLGRWAKNKIRSVELPHFV
jgi:hypothetical protein